MFDTDQPAGSDEDPDAEKRIVCGVCEELLPGTYDGQVPAEDAADQHDEEVHPDRGHVVVVPVSTALVQSEGPEEVVELAKGAQQRLDEGEVGEGLLG